GSARPATRRGETPMLLTMWCILVILGSLLLAGLLACWLLNGRQPLRARDHCQAPFIGLAVLFLIPENLLPPNVPVPRSPPLVWAALLSAWVGLYRGGRLGDVLRGFPWPLGLGCLLVYLVQGLGMLRLGVSHYVGRGWTDMMNYVDMAQFFADVPFHTGWAG